MFRTQESSILCFIRLVVINITMIFKNFIIDNKMIDIV